MTITEQKKAAAAFAKRWAGQGKEKQDDQEFWRELLSEVYGIEDLRSTIQFQKEVKFSKDGATKWIDAYMPQAKVIIEQKSLGVNLDRVEIQGDGATLSPYGQAKRYNDNLPQREKANWIITCNFAEFHIHDMNNPLADPTKVLLKDLDKDFHLMEFLVDGSTREIQREKELSIKAGELVGELYDMLLPQYRNPEDPETLKNLNKLCVRIVFCLYAEDAGLFNEMDMFYKYLDSYRTGNIRKALLDLFDILDTKEEDRDPYAEELNAFPYINGGLFRGPVEIPTITPEIVDLIKNKMSRGFDWSEISPTIFGAVFESTLNPETRRKGGMHYTSITNIHKVIDPLFLDGLKREFEEVCAIKSVGNRNTALMNFQQKIAGLKFLDPAAGSGNFLTETYISLRRMENDIIRMLSKDGVSFLGGEFSPIKVSITQFYGIEINDFAVSVAKTALWIAESQMMLETQSIVGTTFDFFPLTTNAGIVEGNALRINWNDIVPASELNYIMGNPPFIGARMKTPEQAADLEHVFGPKWKNLGNMDYVCGWYKLASDLMRDTTIHAALVSTNSITQGEQVANLWKPLFEDGIRINFAYKTFRWDSEASLKAHVHCVIVGFSRQASQHPFIADEKGERQDVEQINPYLVEADPVFIESRSNPICDVPQIGIGNQPIDGGNYLFKDDEMQEFVRKEPKSEKYFRKWWGSDEFIQQHPRYCLWLGDCTPAELRSMPLALERVKNVQEFRLASKRSSTLKLADKPTHFQVENMPNSEYIIIPRVSSERRLYVPMGYLPPTDLTSDSAHIIPNATLYHFGVLTSSVHMAWMRVVCGRLEMRYRYSKDIVYNNFPWPTPTDEQQAKIEQTAQDILYARAHYPDCSLADLYDPLTMPNDLRTAHRLNDQAVLEAYGYPKNISEADIVADLFNRYQQLTEK